MRSRFTIGRLAFLAAFAFVLAVFAGSATAYWGGPGTGETEIQLDDPRALTLSSGIATAGLFPGGDASVAVRAENPNGYPVLVQSLELDAAAGDGGFEVDPGHSSCDLSAIGFETGDNGGEGWTVPPRTGSIDGSLPISMTGALTMAAGAEDACQGAAFTIHLTEGT